MLYIQHLHREVDHVARRIRRLSFNDLVQMNKRELLKDKEALDKIELRLEEKHMKEA